jgi:hypothetical protein
MAKKYFLIVHYFLPKNVARQPKNYNYKNNKIIGPSLINRRPSLLSSFWRQKIMGSRVTSRDVRSEINLLILTAELINTREKMKVDQCRLQGCQMLYFQTKKSQFG